MGIGATLLRVERALWKGYRYNAVDVFGVYTKNNVIWNFRVVAELL